MVSLVRWCSMPLPSDSNRLKNRPRHGCKLSKLLKWHTAFSCNIKAIRTDAVSSPPHLLLTHNSSQVSTLSGLASMPKDKQATIFHSRIHFNNIILLTLATMASKMDTRDELAICLVVTP